MTSIHRSNIIRVFSILSKHEAFIFQKIEVN